MEINVAAVCEQGLEDISAREIKELIGKDVKKEDEAVTFKATMEELAILCYKGQSVRKVLVLISEGNFEDIDSVEIKSVPFKAESFAVECEKAVEFAVKSPDIEQELNQKVKAISKMEIDLKNPKLKLYIFIKKKYYFGVDLAGLDLSNRDYKVFSHAASLKGTVAYGIIRIAGYSKEKSMLSCLTKSGMFGIEAALHASGKAANYYRKDKFSFHNYTKIRLDEGFCEDKLRIKETHSDLRHINAAKRNAKIAGVEKLMEFGRLEMDWMELKFSQLDIIIAQPAGSEFKHLKELFRQAKESLAADGVLVIVSAKKLDYKITRKIIRGKSEIYIYVFGRDEVST